MKTLTVDDQKCIRIPDAKPRQKFTYQNQDDRTILLKPVNKRVREPFPPGSMNKFITPERNREMLEIFRGFSANIPE